MINNLHLKSLLREKLFLLITACIKKSLLYKERLIYNHTHQNPQFQALNKKTEEIIATRMTLANLRLVVPPKDHSLISNSIHNLIKRHNKSPGEMIHKIQSDNTILIVRKMIP